MNCPRSSGTMCIMGENGGVGTVILQAGRGSVTVHFYFRPMPYLS